MTLKMGQSLRFVWVMISLVTGLISMDFTYVWNTQIPWKYYSWRTTMMGPTSGPGNLFEFNKSDPILEFNNRVISNPNLHICFTSAIAAIVTGIISFSSKQTGSKQIWRIMALYGIAFGVVVIVTVFINIQGLLQPPIMPGGAL
jgi:hypothetical protein